MAAPEGLVSALSGSYRIERAVFDWVAPAAGTYRLRVTFFERVITGSILVARK